MVVEKFCAVGTTGEGASTGERAGEFDGEHDFALRSKGCSSTTSVSLSSLLEAASNLKLLVAAAAAGKYQGGMMSAAALDENRKLNDFPNVTLFIAATAAIADAATDSRLDIEFNWVLVKYDSGMFDTLNGDLWKFTLFPLSETPSSLSSLSYELSLEWFCVFDCS